jgi:microcystin-dependent protein
LAILAAEQLTITCSPGLQFICGSGRHKAVGELPSHFHEIVSNTVNLTGSAGYFVGADSPSYSGILTVTKGSKGLTGGGGGHTQNYLNIHANITPSVNVSVAGNNQPHQNMPPFISIFCWKRTA